MFFVSRTFRWMTAICAGVASTLAAPSGARAGDDSSYRTIVENGQAAGDGLVLSVNVPPPMINDSGTVLFNGLLHDPTQSSTIGDLSTVEVAQPDGTLTEIARQGNSTPDQQGPFATLYYRAINNAGQVVFDALLGHTPSTYGNFVLYRWDGAASYTALHAMGTAAPDGNGVFANAHDLTLLNESGQVAFLSAFANTTHAPYDNTGIYVTDASGALVQVARAGQATPDPTLQYHTFAPFLAFNNAGQVAFESFTAQNAQPYNNGPDALYRFDGPGRIVQIARQGDPTPDGTAAFSNLGLFPQASMNAAGRVAFGCVIGTATGSPQSIFLSDAAGRPSEIVRMGDAIDDAVAGAQLLSLSAPVVNDANQVAFSSQLGGAVTQYAPVICRADPGGNGRGGYQVREIARGGQTVPGGDGTYQGFTTGPVLAAHNDLVLFEATIANASQGIAPDNTGMYVGDGTDTVQVARTNQVIGGLPIYALSVGAGITYQPMNDSGQVVFRATFREPDGYFTDKTILFTPTLSQHANSDGNWDNAANWTLGLMPGAANPVALASDQGATVLGPSASTSVKSIVLGTNLSGTEELRLRTGVQVSVADALTVLASGVLDGEGIVNGLVHNDGTVSPGGASLGTIAAASYVQTAGGILKIDIADPAASAGSASDALIVSGDAILAGGMQVSLLNGYVPPDGARFHILTSGALHGQFDSLTGTDLGNGRFLDPVYGPSGVDLLVVPEPSTLALLAGCILTASRRRRCACSRL